MAEACFKLCVYIFCVQRVETSQMFPFILFLIGGIKNVILYIYIYIIIIIIIIIFVYALAINKRLTEVIS